MLNVGVDLDGCNFIFGKNVENILRKQGRKLIDNPFDSWDFYKVWGIDDNEFVDICNKAADDGELFAGPVEPGAIVALWKIINAGHAVHIITDRQFGTTPLSSRRNTMQWIYENEIPYTTISFSADKTVIKTDVFVEDKIENYDHLVANGTDCYLIDRPWNQRKDSRKRIKDMTEFAEIVCLQPACI